MRLPCYRTPERGDAGVDVVAIRDKEGLLVQCKTSLHNEAGLGWEAVKDVVAGTAFHARKHPGVRFERRAATNRWFNQTAVQHAALNGVELWDYGVLAEWLQRYPVSRFELERCLVDLMP